MRVKKNREVNIFSASVVDLFASGLGVFLIVAIIALVNQKKENLKVGNPEQVNQANEKIITDLEQKLNQAQKELKKALNEVQFLTQAVQEKSGAEGASGELSFEQKLDMKNAAEISSKEIAEKNSQIAKLQAASQDKDIEIKELQKSLETLKTIYKDHELNKQDNKLDVSNFEIGTKIQLNNVQFYAGTDKPIEPYASKEITQLAKVLLENRNIKVEVSGHIFLSQDELEKGDVFDDSNLSGRRAKVVCAKLISMGVNEERLKCVGYGGKRYLYLTNDQYSEKAQLNRRVEIEILAK